MAPSWIGLAARDVSTVPSSSPLEVSTTATLSREAERSDTRAAG